MESVKNGNLEIVFLKGTDSPEFDYEKNVLTIYTEYQDYNYYQHADIFLDEQLVQVYIIRNVYGFHFKTIHLVKEDNTWNRRYYKDISVKRNLERLGAIRLSRKERHKVTFNFGRSIKGKKALIDLMEIITEEMQTLSSFSNIRYRNWDESQDVLVDMHATKVNLELSGETIEQLAEILMKARYVEEAFQLKGQFLKSLLEFITLEIDFSKNFAKKKK